MGGVRVDAETQESTVSGLYASWVVTKWIAWSKSSWRKLAIRFDCIR